MNKNNLLKLNLQYFAEGDGADNSSDVTENTDNAAQGDNENTQSEHMIPKSRFDEINTRYKEVQAKLDEFTQAQKAAETKAQEEAGEFKGLYETMKLTHDSLELRNKELEAVVGDMLSTKLAGIPKELHELIPDNLSTEGKLSWITKAETKGLFGKKEQKPVGSQTNGNPTIGITKEQFQAMTYRERDEIFRTNLELYKRLSK
ncbi:MULTISPECIES: hypothetical protein [Bacillus]|uniref:hypothetical protein n=1 Tax=Bacillus TaxID=1386 RepID=UPI000306509E|nr:MULTISPECIES: hypothetical protein [Bacillus]